jgi:hypothetical protein
MIDITSSKLRTDDSIPDWQSYVPAIGATTTAPTKGTISRDICFYKLIGNELIMNYQYRQTAAGSAGSGYYLFSLPIGYTADMTVIASSTHLYLGTCGYGLIYTTSSGEIHGHVSLHDDGVNFRLMRQIDSLGWVSNGVCPLSNADVIYAVQMRIPVVI